MKDLLKGKFATFYPSDEEQSYTAFILNSDDDYISCFILNYSTLDNVYFTLTDNKWISEEPAGELKFGE